MKASCLLNYDVLSVGQEHKIYLMVKVRAEGAKADGEALPLNLSLVLDRSGSMQGQKLAKVKLAAANLVRRLRPQDRLSLVIFDTEVEIAVPPTSGGDKDAIQRAIQGINSRATTNLSGGWLQGCRLVGQNMAEGAVNRVILLSDGLANVGVRNPSQLVAMAGGKRGEGITTTAFGVGDDFSEDVMAGMAREGGGAFYFIDTPDQAPAFFDEELADLGSVVGQNLTITIETEPPVRGLQQLHNYPHTQQGGALSYQLGDLYGEEERFQVFELSLAPLEAGQHRLGAITIGYDQIKEDAAERVEEAFEVQLEASAEDQIEIRLPRVEVEKMAWLQRAARARQRAVELADQGQFEQAAEVLRQVAAAIEASPIDDEELNQAHNRLLEEAMDMELGEERYTSHARKMHMSNLRHADRAARYASMEAGMHMRHMSMKQAIERHGPAPRSVRWHDGVALLEGDELIIGTAPDCDIQLAPDRGVADHHCRLKNENGDWVLVPYSREADTFANAGLVWEPFHLSEGDVVSIGTTLLQYGGDLAPEELESVDRDKRARALVHQGQKLERADDYAAAADRYRQALSIGSKARFTSYFANNNLGYCLIQMGEFEAAEQYCRSAIQLNPNQHNAHKNLGLSLAGQGDYAGAANALIEAVRRQPGDPRAYQHLRTLIQRQPDLYGEVPDLEGIMIELRDLIQRES